MAGGVDCGGADRRRLIVRNRDGDPDTGELGGGVARRGSALTRGVGEDLDRLWVATAESALDLGIVVVGRRGGVGVRDLRRIRRCCSLSRSSPSRRSGSASCPGRSSSARRGIGGSASCRRSIAAGGADRVEAAPAPVGRRRVAGADAERDARAGGRVGGPREGVPVDGLAGVEDPRVEACPEPG